MILFPILNGLLFSYSRALTGNHTLCVGHLNILFSRYSVATLKIRMHKFIISHQKDNVLAVGERIILLNKPFRLFLVETDGLSYLVRMAAFFLGTYHKFSKTAGRIKDTISNLPVATEADDIDEAAALEAEKESTNPTGNQELPPDNHLGANNGEELDPFGLDALILSKAKKDENSKGKKDTAAKIRREGEDEHKRFLKSQREALIVCLEIAARRYKTPW